MAGLAGPRVGAAAAAAGSRAAAAVLLQQQQQQWGAAAAAPLTACHSTRQLHTGSAALHGHHHHHHHHPRAGQADALLMSLQQQPGRYKAVLVDAAGTLLVPRERTADVYLRYAGKYGVTLSEQQVLERFRSAYNTPWGGSPLRYVGDGRPFWRFIVAASTGSDDPQLFEELYQYYSRPEAWRLAPGAAEALARLRAAGMRLAVVSNFDSRLGQILDALVGPHLFDAVIVSCAVGAEKPNPVIFQAALDALQLPARDVVHVGDDRRNDVWGARDAGITAWLWGVDVHSFGEVERRVLRGGAEGDGEDDDGDDAPQDGAAPGGASS